MEFPFDVARVLREPVTVWDRNAALQLSKDNAPRVREILDRMGQASAKAQGLNIPVTNYNILLQSPDQRAYVFTEGKQVVGIIKVGRKKLFIRSELDVHKEISPLCVLDFYVHESRQRTGKGKMLFEAMMERENIQPWKLAYDRPSTKFVNFLRKHYGLVDFTPQANNFVVFKRYFEDTRSTSRNEQPNASVSMRPLTAPKRRNSYDERVHGQPQQTLGYYTPQKPQHRPESVTPLSLNQLPRNGHNPFSIKSTTQPQQTQQTQQTQQQPQRQQQTQQPSYRSNRSGNLSNRQDSRNNLSTTNNYEADHQDYHDDDRNDYDDRNANYNHHDDEYNEQNHYDDHHNENGSPYDDHIAPEDYANDRAPPRHDPQQQTSYASPTLSRNLPFATTTSSSYGSHSPVAARHASSPTPYRPGPNNTTFNRSYNNSALSGTGVIIGSEYSNDPQPVRGRSPARQRSESPYAETASPTPTRQRSNSLDRSHAPPKGLGTLGSFNQSFTHPIKFEKDLADPPQRKTPYKDSSVLPPRREVTPSRSPAYRLGPASSINSREMDHLENSMRNALSTIDASEKRVNLLEEGGYRAVSPEPKAPSRQDYYQAPQARSIFSPVQPTGSPIMRSVSPARFNRDSSTPEPSLDSTFSKSDYHKKFHTENPNLMSSPPQAVRVHPNSRSRQSPFPS